MLMPTGRVLQTLNVQTILQRLMHVYPSLLIDSTCVCVCKWLDIALDKYISTTIVSNGTHQHEMADRKATGNN